MLKQYAAIKSEHKDCILFFRLGDFYEMFNEDAKIASSVLDLVLTARGKGTANKTPMCGFPHHAAESYIAKLVKAGYKVAICEQVEDPASAKGIVRRDVTRVITSGTYLDDNSYESRLLLSLSPNEKNIGIAFTDPVTGIIQTNQIKYDKNRITELITKLPVCECIYPESVEEDIRTIFESPLLRPKKISLSPVEDWTFNPEMAKKSLLEHYGVKNLHGFGIEDSAYAASSTGALLEYLKRMNKQPLKHMDKISLYTDNDFVFIAPAAYKGLELDTVVTTLNQTHTALGKRKFANWFYHPLKNKEQITERQDAIAILNNEENTRTELKKIFKQIPDIEKNISRLGCGYKNPKDLLAIRNTLCLMPELSALTKPLADKNKLFVCEDIAELRTLLEKSINENMPLAHAEGKIIREGYNGEIDELRSIQANGRDWLKKFQEEEIKRTSIPSLKVGFNKVFGYYIEVTKTHATKVPNDYIRKQTLVNAERYITPTLKEYEEKILSAEEKIFKLENELLINIQKEVLNNSLSLHDLCESIATIDCINALSELAVDHNYTRPDISDNTLIDIKDGRHPVVERMVDDNFIANDTLLDCEENHFIILTGPNMAGKSTYIRQTAILVIMAQMGSFIPAASAHIGLVDKVFTRIGAHDDIARGQSTFMVEMNETADILNNLSERSLVILDEIGRGTSTYDGLALAWALAEHLQASKARTLFATHFHELTSLAETHEGVKNYNVAVKEWKDEIIFLHKIIEGSTDDSYGIYVAKLAGIPKDVIARSRHILSGLENNQNTKQLLDASCSSLVNNQQQATSNKQLDLFTQKTDPAAEEIREELEGLDVNNLTPVEALNKLVKLKEKL